ncbi:MAG TPA: hypothetical protein VG870_05400 [Chitinophagaceae bacterium]|nr:hypothetical protein [Chitinophagaceae bacterium]
MKKLTLLTLGLFTGAMAVLTAILASCTTPTPQPAPQAEISKDSLVKRGEYLVQVMGCDDCHSPKQMGPQGPEVIADRRLSGYQAGRPLPKTDPASIQNGWVMFNSDLTASYGPWGVSFAANLTPDSTGIGVWTEEQFKKALREGKFKGLDNNRPLLPPMPWANFRHLTDVDIKAIYSYLHSIRPVKNVVPAWIPPATK